MYCLLDIPALLLEKFSEYNTGAWLVDLLLLHSDRTRSLSIPSTHLTETYTPLSHILHHMPHITTHKTQDSQAGWPHNTKTKAFRKLSKTKEGSHFRICSLHSAGPTFALAPIYVPCNLETSRSLQTAPCSLQTARSPFQWTTCTCVVWIDNFKENRENCHDFIVLYCVRNWEGISVVENLVRHNNRSFRANKLVIVSPNYKQENE